MFDRKWRFDKQRLNVGVYINHSPTYSECDKETPGSEFRHPLKNLGYMVYCQMVSSKVMISFRKKYLYQSQLISSSYYIANFGCLINYSLYYILISSNLCHGAHLKYRRRVPWLAKWAVTSFRRTSLGHVDLTIWRCSTGISEATDGDWAIWKIAKSWWIDNDEINTLCLFNIAMV